jgi:hypothetical protein
MLSAESCRRPAAGHRPHLGREKIRSGDTSRLPSPPALSFGPHGGSAVKLVKAARRIMLKRRKS